mmetsp:Transcript_22522/g.52419  ORF Transcript_22522/g.52419 Transcript_22522/m.52419 type:complete len:84 (+) Transcript_22522:246-497(+)
MTTTAAGCERITQTGLCSLTSRGCDGPNGLWGNADEFQCDTCDADQCNLIYHPLASSSSGASHAAAPMTMVLLSLFSVHWLLK